MPTVLREAGWRFYFYSHEPNFYSHEPNEPPHVHVDKGDGSVKVWLSPVAVAGSVGVAAHDLNDVLRRVRRHRERLMEAWHGYFSGQGG